MPSHIFLARNRDLDPSDIGWSCRRATCTVVIDDGHSLDALSDVICGQRRPGASHPRLNTAGDPADRVGIKRITWPCGVHGWHECIDHLIHTWWDGTYAQRVPL